MDKESADISGQYPNPSPSPREGKGTRAAGGKGLPSDETPVHFKVSRQTRNSLIEQARHMRSHPTQAEALLWQELRGRKLAGYKFRRQHVIGPFIVDFYCPTRKLVIEIDGPVHQSQIEYDAFREDVLRTMGNQIISFKNERVINKLSAVLKDIFQIVSREIERDG